jgi:predicted amidohydrolase YtcJ
MAIADEYWGSRCTGAYAWRSLLESGAILAFGSDAPVEEPNVLRGIFASVTREREDGTPGEAWYPEQRLTVPQAVHAYTMGAAYASGEERWRGSLTVGKHADMVVLSKNIFDLPSRDILQTRVDVTIIAGEVVYSAS